MEIKKIENKPDEIIPAFVSCIVLPNGEVMMLGKRIGMFDELVRYLYVVK